MNMFCLWNGHELGETRYQTVVGYTVFPQNSCLSRSFQKEKLNRNYITAFRV